MNLNQHKERNIFLYTLVIVSILGGVLGYLAEFIAVYLLVYIVYQYSRLRQLNQWAQSEAIDEAPFEDGLFGLLADHISQSKKQRNVQKESVKYQLDRFRKLVSVFPDGVVIVSLTNEIQWFNHRASGLLSLKKGDVGQSILHLIRAPGFVQFIERPGSSEVVVIDVPGSEASGASDKIEIRVLSYGDDEKLVLVRDVTAIERVSKVKQDFISNASHELRTPLTVMKGYLEMILLSADDEDKFKAPMLKVDQQLTKMQTMISELLHLSRLDEEGAKLTSQQINVRELCEIVRCELQVMADERQQKLEFDIAKHISIQVNKNSLLTVVRNLVSNAIYYSDKEGTVSVMWHYDDRGNGVLSVKDTGKGIAARHLARLTERFYRVPEKNSLNKTGTGLGLAIVKHELERYGAKLVVDSKLNEGSCFQCVFPSDDRDL